MMILLVREITCWSQTMITTKIGQNAWFVKTGNNPVQDKPDNLDNFYPDIFQSGAQYIRIGGARANFKQMFTLDQNNDVDDATNLIYLIDKIVANGMEPIIQVSFEPQNLCTAPVGQQEGNLLGTLSQADQAKVAGSLVAFLKNHYTNNPPPGNPGFKVKYYIISNEPDNSVDCSNGGGFGFNGGGTSPTQALIEAHASAISSYIQDFAEEMKNADATIKIIAPGLTYFSTDDNDPNARMYSQLISLSHPSSIMGNISTIGAGNGLPFVDIVSFHMYPNLSTRSAVITNLNSTTSSFKAKCSVSMTGKTGLVQRIEGAGRTAGNCKIACTEFNLEDAGLNLDESNAADYKTIIEGSSNRSYIGGQWMAATLCQAFLPVNSTNQQWVEFMTPWSVKEGVCKPINSDDRTFGYIGCTAGGNKKRPSYWLYQMVAKNFKDELLTTSCTAGNYQAFAYKNNDVSPGEIGVLLMNMDQTGPGSYGKTFRVNLDGTMPSITGINVNVAAGCSTGVEHTCYIKSESTVLLKFNLAGVLQSRTEYSIEEAKNNVGPKTWNVTGAADAYIADHPGDVGNQPNQEIVTQNGGISWASKDIWVRNSDEIETVTGNNRYPNEHDHQNPQWTGTPGNEPYVFVKVRNRGCSPITGNVLAYWDNASTGLTW